MELMKATFTEFIEKNENLLKKRWSASVEVLKDRVEHLQVDSPIFQDIRELLMSLVALVEKKGSAEQAVDSQLKPIVKRLQHLQNQHQLNSTEMVFFLFLMRDILKELIGETKILRENELAYVEALNQVSSLLNRLGLVFFEGAMRLKLEDGIGQQDVLAIEYALLYERTRQIAITDRLTGLYNFGYFHERLKEERMRAERYHRLLSLIIFDIDHFKKYNDANGHPAGNEVLKKIAAILKEEAREVDIVARYGGEEMVIVLPETSRRRSAELAQRILDRISSTRFSHMESQPMKKITVSAGVATYPVDADNEEDLVKKADSSLYQAKSEGRDRVVSFKPSVQVNITYKPYRDIAQVALVGNFNNWDKNIDHMVKQSDGSFKFTFQLNPGLYHYKFVLNDVEWIADPGNPERVPDAQGAENSLLRVTL